MQAAEAQKQRDRFVQSIGNNIFIKGKKGKFGNDQMFEDQYNLMEAIRQERVDMRDVGQASGRPGYTYNQMNVRDPAKGLDPALAELVRRAWDDASTLDPSIRKRQKTLDINITDPKLTGAGQMSGNTGTKLSVGGMSEGIIRSKVGMRTSDYQNRLNAAYPDDQFTRTTVEKLQISRVNSNANATIFTGKVGYGPQDATPVDAIEGEKLKEGGGEATGPVKGPFSPQSGRGYSSSDYSSRAGSSSGEPRRRSAYGAAPPLRLRGGARYPTRQNRGPPERFGYSGALSTTGMYGNPYYDDYSTGEDTPSYFSPSSSSSSGRTPVPSPSSSSSSSVQEISPPRRRSPSVGSVGSLGSDPLGLVGMLSQGEEEVGILPITPEEGEAMQLTPTHGGGGVDISDYDFGPGNTMKELGIGPKAGTGHAREEVGGLLAEAEAKSEPESDFDISPYRESMRQFRMSHYTRRPKESYLRQQASEMRRQKRRRLFGSAYESDHTPSPPYFPTEGPLASEMTNYGPFMTAEKEWAIASRATPETGAVARSIPGAEQMGTENERMWWHPDLFHRDLKQRDRNFKIAPSLRAAEAANKESDAIVESAMAEIGSDISEREEKINEEEKSEDILAQQGAEGKGIKPHDPISSDQNTKEPQEPLDVNPDSDEIFRQPSPRSPAISVSSNESSPGPIPPSPSSISSSPGFSEDEEGRLKLSEQGVPPVGMPHFKPTKLTGNRRPLTEAMAEASGVPYPEIAGAHRMKVGSTTHKVRQHSDIKGSVISFMKKFDPKFGAVWDAAKKHLDVNEQEQFISDLTNLGSIPPEEKQGGGEWTVPEIRAYIKHASDRLKEATAAANDLTKMYAMRGHQSRVVNERIEGWLDDAREDLHEALWKYAQGTRHLYEIINKQEAGSEKEAYHKELQQAESEVRKEKRAIKRSKSKGKQ